jgi:hypothetical protein
MPVLTVSGNEITDATRRRGVQGDGRVTPDATFGSWEASTNHIKNGGAETNTLYATADGSAAFSRSTLRSKFGNASFRVVADGAVANQAVHFLPSSADQPAAASGQVWTFSAWIYVEATTGGANSFMIQIVERDNTGAFLTALTQSFTPTVGQWVRVTLTHTLGSASATKVNAKIGQQSTGIQSTYFVDGAQLEQQPLATPYIETDGATASRAFARVQAPTTLVGATQGWVAARVRVGWGSAADNGANAYVFNWGLDSGNWITMRHSVGSGAAWRLATRVGGVSSGEATQAGSAWLSGDILTIIGAWTETQAKVAYGGSAFTAVARSSVGTPPAETFEIGAYQIQGLELDGDILWTAVGTGTLTDADSALIHGFGNTPPIPEMLPGAANVTAVIPGALFPDYITHPILPTQE